MNYDYDPLLCLFGIHRLEQSVEFPEQYKEILSNTYKNEMI